MQKLKSRFRFTGDDGPTRESSKPTLAPVLDEKGRRRGGQASRQPKTPRLPLEAVFQKQWRALAAAALRAVC